MLFLSAETFDLPLEIEPVDFSAFLNSKRKSNVSEKRASETYFLQRVTEQTTLATVANRAEGLIT